MNSRMLKAHPASDGAGVKINRVNPAGNFALMDPFLMLDEIRSNDAEDYGAGFPAHPHRGFETITYMRQGQLEHEDHMGNTGIISDGGAQWMTAGRGVIHSEMPKQTQGAFHGFQLWLNLPAEEKMRAAEYHDISVEQIPILTVGGHQVRVLAGKVSIQGQDATGPIDGRATKPLLLDIALNESTPLMLPDFSQSKKMIYVYEGEITLRGETIPKNTLAILDLSHTEIAAPNKAKALLLGGEPLNEPVVQYGPFVMNNREQIEQAIHDYQAGVLTGV